MRRGLIVLLLVFVTGCSTLGVGKAVVGALGGGSGPSLDVETTLGDKTQEVNTEIGDDIQQEAHVINNVRELDPFLLLLAIAGWLAPTPGQCWRYLTSYLRASRKK